MKTLTVVLVILLFAVLWLPIWYDTHFLSLQNHVCVNSVRSIKLVSENQP